MSETYWPWFYRNTTLIDAINFYAESLEDYKKIKVSDIYKNISRKLCEEKYLLWGDEGIKDFNLKKEIIGDIFEVSGKLKTELVKKIRLICRL